MNKKIIYKTLTLAQSDKNNIRYYVLELSKILRKKYNICLIIEFEDVNIIFKYYIFDCILISKVRYETICNIYNDNKSYKKDALILLSIIINDFKVWK